jgi:phosphatidylserine/phosphatidylglycerophosphate/cardiolipin synthase-like enzyme
MARTLIVLPDDTPQPVMAAIAGARSSICIKMFVLSDPAAVAAVISAKHRGVHVRVLLNPRRRGGERENERVGRALRRAGVLVRDASSVFDVTHEKSMVVDNVLALIGSFNWTTRNFTETRDYGVLTKNRHDVEEVAAGFEADWRHHAFVPKPGSHLIWSPNDSRARICEFIDSARDHLFVQNERFQDMIVIDSLLRAARRGVKVHVMGRAPHTLQRDKIVEGVGGLRILHDVGVKVHRLQGLKLHGKMILVDGVAAIVGSMNLAPGSFDSRRELGIEIHGGDTIDRLQKIARHDWKHSRPLDLSDDGLLADLESRVDDAGPLLGLS